MIKLWRKKKKSIMVSVPELKEYLVKEFETTKKLQQKIADLEAEVYTLRDIEVNYETAMVTLDGYSKKLDFEKNRYEVLLSQKRNVDNILDKTRDEVNNYKIKYHEASLTRDEIIDDITDETKSKLCSDIILAITNHKGGLSKASACELVKKVTNGDLRLELKIVSEVSDND